MVEDRRQRKPGRRERKPEMDERHSADRSLAGQPVDRAIVVKASVIMFERLHQSRGDDQHD